MQLLTQPAGSYLQFRFSLGFIVAYPPDYRQAATCNSARQLPSYLTPIVIVALLHNKVTSVHGRNF